MKITEMEVTYLDHMGTDLTVVNAARVSFNKESDWELSSENEIPYLSTPDARLIGYLAKHNHWTTFGHCFAQFRIKAPIFVARQLVKHQVGLVWNEVSRRYVDDEPEFWIPKVWRKRPDDGKTKQGSGANFSDEDGADIEGMMYCSTHDAVDTYNNLIKIGVAPEQARMCLPLNAHTEWYWSGSLAAWARVCKLRLDPHAQAETREVAEGINLHMASLFPVAWKALMG